MIASALQDSIRRMATRLLAPFGLAVESRDQAARQLQRRQELKASLAHEREKIRKLKQRLVLDAARADFAKGDLSLRLEQADAERVAMKRKLDRFQDAAWRASKELAHASGQLEEAKTNLQQAIRDRDLFRRQANTAAKKIRMLRDESELSSEPLILAAARAHYRATARASVLEPSKLHAGSGSFSANWPALEPPAAGAIASAWSPLRVATVGPWRSVFASVPRPEILVRELGDPLVEAPDVLVFPKCELFEFAERACTVPKAVWRRVQERQTTVVMDSSAEGYPWSPGLARALHSFLADYAVHPGCAVYLTQNRLYEKEYRGWCAEERIAAMRTVVFDAFIGRTLQNTRVTGRSVFEERLAAFADRPQHRSRRFVSLNYSARPTKVLFLLRLIRDGIWDQGWVSFGGFDHEGDVQKLSKLAAIAALAAREGFAEEMAGLAPLADQLEAMGPVLFGLDPKGNRLRKDSIRADELPQYADSWFTVVTETEMLDRAHRITEKPLKPLLNLHPFLVLGNPGSLALLRGYGFETYSTVFDERYDEEPDPRRRFDMVYEQVRLLCAIDEAELARMTDEASEILAFNACWGLTELPRRFNEIIVPAVIDQLAPPSRKGRC